MAVYCWVTCLNTTVDSCVTCLIVDVHCRGTYLTMTVYCCGTSLSDCVLLWDISQRLCIAVGHLSATVYCCGTSLSDCVLLWDISQRLCIAVGHLSATVYCCGTSLSDCVLLWDISQHAYGLLCNTCHYGSYCVIVTLYCCVRFNCDYVVVVQVLARLCIVVSCAHRACTRCQPTSTCPTTG